MSEKKDYYKILKVNSNATNDDIKKAYKKLAMKYHPDKNLIEDKKMCEERFKEVSEAYQILSDKDSKKTYDYQRKFGTIDSFSGFNTDIRDPFEMFSKHFDNEIFNTHSTAFGSDIFKKMNNDMNQMRNMTSMSNSTGSFSQSRSSQSVSTSTSCINGIVTKKTTKIATVNGKTTKEITEEKNGVVTTTIFHPDGTIENKSSAKNAIENKSSAKNAIENKSSAKNVIENKSSVKNTIEAKTSNEIELNQNDGIIDQFKKMFF